jgi:toxin-antitoxin system PIN domain toxin
MVHLLDVNVLVALLWSTHIHHERAHSWFQKNSKHGWATCPLTQAGAIRILSNPSITRDAMSVQEATKYLASNLQHPTHQFWTDDLTFMQAVESVQTRLFGHKQITDAYLLGLAIHRKGGLVTLDQAMIALLLNHKTSSTVVVVI